MKRTKIIESTIPIITLLVVVALSIIALIFAVQTTNFPVNTINNILFGLLLALFIIGFLIFICICILLYWFLARLLIPSKTQKRVEALKGFREEIISGGLNDPNKIRDRWEKIDTMFEKKRNEKKHAFSTRTRLFIGLIIGLIFVALLIALGMLVTSLLIKLVLLILLIPIFFAIVTIFRNELEKNEKTVADQRFGDALIGIISGLVASYLMWALLTSGETSLSLSLLVFLAVSLVFVVSLLLVYSLIVVLVFFTRN